MNEAADRRRGRATGPPATQGIGQGDGRCRQRALWRRVIPSGWPWAVVAGCGTGEVSTKVPGAARGSRIHVLRSPGGGGRMSASRGQFSGLAPAHEPGCWRAGTAAPVVRGRDDARRAAAPRGWEGGVIPMRVLLLVLTLTLMGSSAAAQNICDPRWLQTASGADVRAVLRDGNGRQPGLQRQQQPAPAPGDPDGGRLSGRVPGARRGGSRYRGREHRREQPARLGGAPFRARGTRLAAEPAARIVERSRSTSA